MARVLVDKGVLHLDRYFDYAVPEELDADAQPGVRVRVRFGAGRHRVREGRREGGGLIDGFLVERVAESDYSGPLAALAQVVSPERVLSEELLGLARAVADRYAGGLADVLQLAVPPRSARAEQRPSPEPLPPPGKPEAGSWGRYERGAGFLDALASGGAPRAVWNALPGPEWSEELARAVVATLASGRGALVVLPDGRAVARVDAALTSLMGEGRHAVLTADAGPEKRYREWLAVRRGSVRAVVGTRAAMFAPVQDLGLVALWDDGDDSHSEQHAPQPHAREVLLLRAAQDKCAFLMGSWSCTVEAAQLVESGWARPLVAAREQVRGAAPLVRTVGDGDLARDEAARAARLPTLAWQAVREGLRTGPVLVQVPRRGYVPRMACANCRAPARCRHCSGPLEAQGSGADLKCGWCGRDEGAWHCPECGGFRLRAQVVGARRTAEELGRAFPAVPVRTSGREHVLDTVPGTPALVVSTPGAEPVAEGGYAAALLLDGWAMLGRPDLRAGRTRCAAGSRRPRWYGRRAPVGRWSSSPSPRCGPYRRWCGGTPSGTPCASSASGPSWGFRRCPGWPRCPGRGGGRRVPPYGRAAAGRRGVGAGAGCRHGGGAASSGGRAAAGGAVGPGVDPGAAGERGRVGRGAEGRAGGSDGAGRERGRGAGSD